MLLMYYVMLFFCIFDIDEVIGKFVMNYQLSKDNMVYISWFCGYKFGGINGGVVNVMVVSIIIEFEIVDVFEIGSKN